MVKIEHIRQVNDGHNWKCGAVCLEMIFNFYGIPCNQDDIWEKIKSKRNDGIEQYYSHTVDLAKYSVNKGLKAYICKAKPNCVEIVLSLIDTDKRPVIMSILEKKSQNSHFVIYTGKKNGRFYFTDPNRDKTFSYYTLSEVEDFWKPRPEIDVAGYIFVAFDNYDLELYKDYLEFVVDLYKDEMVWPNNNHL